MSDREKIRIVEVGPRDGLQNLKTIVATKNKISLIRRLAESGIREIQAGGFVNPKTIPQFSDMKDVISGIDNLSGVLITAMVPNLQGARDALASGIRKLDFFFSVSRSHNLNNVRQTPEESMKALEAIVEQLIKDAGVTVRVDLATVFGCPFEGFIKKSDILRYADKVVKMGIREITLCDTVGFGDPLRVEDITGSCRKEFPEVIFGVHFHNTRGLGLANALRAYDVGIRNFESAIGGLGGCPFAPGASGNVATEDVAFMFGQMGLETGVNISKLLKASQFLQSVLPDVKLASAVFQAGMPKRVAFEDMKKGDKLSC